MQQPGAPKAILSQSREVAQRALRQLLAIAASDDTSTITLNVQTPALPIRFRVGEATAAALAATGKLAADLWDLRRGETQQIIVSTRAASASLLSFTLQQFEEPEKAPPPRLDPEQRTAFAGFHQTRDDRIFYLHPGLPHHTEGLRRLLDCEDAKQRSHRPSRSGRRMPWRRPLRKPGCVARWYAARTNGIYRIRVACWLHGLW